jgi:hypothetical protein
MPIDETKGFSMDACLFWEMPADAPVLSASQKRLVRKKMRKTWKRLKQSGVFGRPKIFLGDTPPMEPDIRRIYGGLLPDRASLGTTLFSRCCVCKGKTIYYQGIAFRNEDGHPLTVEVAGLSIPVSLEVTIPMDPVDLVR